VIQFKHTATYTNIHDAFIWNGYAPANIAPVDPIKERIQVVQEQLLKMPQADIVTLHNFLPGTYERTMKTPASCMIVGAAHKTPYRVRLEQGTITVNIGNDVKTLTAPCEFDAPAGEQRVGFAHDEVIWVDIYENSDNCTNIDVLEERLYVVPECGLYDYRKRNGLLQLGETLWLP
jgi:hypothetical protein